jgi:hypothetical protein
MLNVKERKRKRKGQRDGVRDGSSVVDICI